MSSRAPICDHCGYQSGEAGEEDLQRFRARRLRNQIYRLSMATYAVMTALIVAFAWYLIGTGGFQTSVNNNGPIYLMGASALAYLVVRVLLFRARRQRKEIRRAR